jgi:hypothetical protein
MIIHENFCKILWNFYSQIFRRLEWKYSGGTVGVTWVSGNWVGIQWLFTSFFLIWKLMNSTCSVSFKTDVMNKWDHVYKITDQKQAFSMGVMTIIRPKEAHASSIPLNNFKWVTQNDRLKSLSPCIETHFKHKSLSLYNKYKIKINV